MAVDAELAKTLNLLRTSPTFAATQRPDGSLALGTPDRILSDTGVVWLAAHCTLAQGQMVDAVIVIDTAIGDIPQAVYWWIGSAWFEPADPHDRTATLAVLDLGEKAVFPYATAPQIALDLR